jgi:hypothetical protein
LSVARECQRRGLGWRTRVDRGRRRGHGARTMLLEVRPSNPWGDPPLRSLRIPAHWRSPRVLPAAGGREDAIVCGDPVTLDQRRTRIWSAMGPGPVWTLRNAGRRCAAGGCCDDGCDVGRRAARAAHRRHGLGRTRAVGRWLHRVCAEPDADEDRLRCGQSVG